MASLLPLLVLLLCLQSPLTTSLTLSVADYGAIGDGRCYDTSAIQSAIDACAAAGGGRVVFPSGGTYLTKTLNLRSGVVLRLERGSRILGGTRRGDYPAEQRRWYVVLAEDAKGVGIEGEGTIDGQGGAFVERIDDRKNVMVSWNGTGMGCLGDECRPRLVGFLGCEGVAVSGIRFVQPAYWCLHLVRCDRTTIRDVQIKGDWDTPNNDGIDVEDSNNTLIERVRIDTGDDAICPKSSTGPVVNLVARDCWIRTKSSAIKLGSASWFDFKNFLFDNITVVDSHRGLALQIRDGGSVNNVTFSNINISTRYYDPSWWGRAEPIYVTSCPRDRTSKSGAISDLLFINISAVSENGVFLSGSLGAPLHDLRFINVNLTYKRWTNYSGGLFDYRPGCHGFVKHGTAGVMVEHVNGLVMENVKMKWVEENGLKGWDDPMEFRPDSVTGLALNGVTSYVERL
ncbi:hypothetical protein QJS10_CPB19g01041 [Acorus calamus]|uniref:Rhamnogalacturonase A/B/Epimerase-like pectate lyase domain-containing protein n=1 Tax=Acorus calamus TaxID=4465 RepID=A0AAV9CGX5_ACOCL|nr:hypothetical protein QJS10_CPB19g01041 [Acorus calamus]